MMTTRETKMMNEIKEKGSIIIDRRRVDVAMRLQLAGFVNNEKTFVPASVGTREAWIVTAK